MKKIIILALILLSCQTAFASISVTEEQFNNLGVLTQELKKKNTSFIGFNGTKDKLEVFGISEQQAISEIKKIDIKDVKIKNPKKKARISAISKLKTVVGFTDEELDSIGLKEEA